MNESNFIILKTTGHYLITLIHSKFNLFISIYEIHIFDSKKKKSLYIYLFEISRKKEDMSYNILH